MEDLENVAKQAKNSQRKQTSKNAQNDDDHNNKQKQCKNKTRAKHHEGNTLQHITKEKEK